MPEIYVSTDVETDGPIPGPHSMLSIGSAAFLPDHGLVSTFTANLETLEGATPHPHTMQWWKRQPEAWAACRENPRPPVAVMTEYAAWLDGLPGHAVFVAYPLGFDFTFVYWYLMRFAGRSPFTFSGVDVKSFAMALLGTEFRKTTKRSMPDRWFDRRRHTHVALDDALEQGELFLGMLADSRDR
jgi:hypothetical protein